MSDDFGVFAQLAGIGNGVDHHQRASSTNAIQERRASMKLFGELLQPFAAAALLGADVRQRYFAWPRRSSESCALAFDANNRRGLSSFRPTRLVQVRAKESQTVEMRVNKRLCDGSGSSYRAGAGWANHDTPGSASRQLQGPRRSLCTRECPEAQLPYPKREKQHSASTCRRKRVTRCASLSGMPKRALPLGPRPAGRPIGPPPSTPLDVFLTYDIGGQYDNIAAAHRTVELPNRHQSTSVAIINDQPPVRVSMSRTMKPGRPPRFPRFPTSQMLPSIIHEIMAAGQKLITNCPSLYARDRISGNHFSTLKRAEGLTRSRTGL